MHSLVFLQKVPWMIFWFKVYFDGDFSTLLTSCPTHAPCALIIASFFIFSSSSLTLAIFHVNLFNQDG